MINNNNNNNNAYHICQSEKSKKKILNSCALLYVHIKFFYLIIKFFENSFPTKRRKVKK